VPIASMFILKKKMALVFTTDIDTRHGQEFLKNPLVAGSVVLETMIIGKIRGIQFQGIISEPKDEKNFRKQRNAYSEKISGSSIDGYETLDSRTDSHQDD